LKEDLLSWKRMKLFVSILASVVLLLSTQCLIMANDVAVTLKPMKESCCSKKKACDKQQKKEAKRDCQQQKDKGCKDVCNPFMSCCGCLYDALVKNDLTINKPIQQSEKTGVKDNFFKSAYVSGLWQPPEIVII
jgi:hypothetical protein